MLRVSKNHPGKDNAHKTNSDAKEKIHERARDRTRHQFRVTVAIECPGLENLDHRQDEAEQADDIDQL